MVTVLVEPRMAALFRRSLPDVNIVDRLSFDDQAPLFDVQIRMGDLSEFKGAARHAVFIAPNPELRAKIRARHANPGRPLVVGLCWHGGNTLQSLLLRSITPAALRPLLEVEGVRWVSLQHHAEQSDIEMLRRNGVRFDETIDFLGDMDAVAALVAAMDLVITVNSTNAHLAGALGVPAMVFLPLVAPWHWGLRSTVTPWYPNMRLIRSAAEGGWPPAIETARQLLLSLSAARAEDPSMPLDVRSG
jgi:hypothetical protein